MSSEGRGVESRPGGTWPYQATLQAQAYYAQALPELSFLILIGTVLMLEGLGKHVEKGYIYFAMAFALGVELVNVAVRNRSPVQLKQTYVVRDDDRPDIPGVDAEGGEA